MTSLLREYSLFSIVNILAVGSQTLHHIFQLFLTLAMEFIRSERGGAKLICEGFIYVKQK